MTIHWFSERIRKDYSDKHCEVLYRAYKDEIELYFYIEDNHTTCCIVYAGETIRESTFKDMKRRISDDLYFYQKEGD